MQASLRLLSDICSIPTAPFVEHRVFTFVEAWAKKHKIRVTRDRFGNRMFSVGPKPRKGQKRLVLAAHTDHPGFVAEKMTGPRELQAFFRGGVLADYVNGCKVKFFVGNSEIRGVVTSVAGMEKDRPYPTSATIRVSKEVPPGSAGMFDLPLARVTKTHFQSRVCDDLAGAAGALAALEILAKKPPKLPFAVLLTRAEEVGFVGALAAVTEPELLRKEDDLLFAIECSAEQPFAKQQDGVILRVGDRISIFNSSLTAFLNDTAQAIAKRDKTFKFQRALMPGGACESTVYDAWGYHAAAVCMPLGNYHNHDKVKKVLAPENIALSDYLHMVQLFVELARTAHTYVPGHGPLKERLGKRFTDMRHLLLAGNAT